VSIARNPVSLCPAKIAVSARGSLALSLILGLRLISLSNGGAISALSHGENGPATLPFFPAPFRSSPFDLSPTFTSTCVTFHESLSLRIAPSKSLLLNQSPFTEHPLRPNYERAVLVLCLASHSAKQPQARFHESRPRSQMSLVILRAITATSLLPISNTPLPSSTCSATAITIGAPSIFATQIQHRRPQNVSSRSRVQRNGNF
jgi:hypothetical protein